MRFFSPYSRLRGQWLWLLPVVVTIVFVQAFAPTLPVTDEWMYVHRIWKLHGIDWSTLAGWREACGLYPVQVSEHLVGVPFAFYWPLAELSDFDTRWAIYLTVISFVGQVWIYRRFVVKETVWALPLSLVMLSPAHYMEFVWGWQITLSLSVFFPLLGLAALDQVTPEMTGRPLAWRLTAGYACLVLGAFSSAGGFMGFPCALLLLVVKPWSWFRRLGFGAVVGVTAAVIYALFLRDDTRRLAQGMRPVWQGLTALGGAIWGTPGGLVKFGLDHRSFAGILVVLAALYVSVRATMLRQWSRVALPVCIMVFGFMCVLPIALSRSYLGNWHLQYALPAVCGLYAAAWQLWKVDGSRWTRLVFFGLALMFVGNVGASLRAFWIYGPESRIYTDTIGRHALQNLETPGVPPPYPKQNIDLDARLALFLSAHEHAVFDGRAPHAPFEPLPAGAKVYLGSSLLADPTRWNYHSAATDFLTVALPAGLERAGVVAKIGDWTLVLRRVHPKHVPKEIPDENWESFYMGMILPSHIPKGDVALHLQTYGSRDTQVKPIASLAPALTWDDLQADPVRFTLDAGSNLFVGKMTSKGYPLALKESRKLRFLGAAGGHELRLNYGLYRLQGEMVAEVGPGFMEKGTATFQVFALEADGPKEIWKETITITRGEPRITRSFAVSAGGNPVRLVANTEQGSMMVVGWHGLTIPHSGELEAEPPALYSSASGEAGWSTPVGTSLFAAGQAGHWSLRAYAAAPPQVQARGLAVDSPSEVWVRVDQPRSRLSGRVTLVPLETEASAGQIVRVQVVYYKSGRLHLLYQQDHPASALRYREISHDFTHGIPEPVGWVGLIVKPLNPKFPPGARAIWSEVSLQP